MSGYTPVFDSVYDGTLCGRWPALPVWLTLLPLADWRGHIDLTPEAIAGRTGWPLELLLAGIDHLCKPDPRSRSKSEDGRRLVLLDADRDWGWRVVNIQTYRNKASGKDQVEDGRNAEKVRRYKERQKTLTDTTGHLETPTDTNSYADTNSNSDARKESTAQAPSEYPPEFLDFKLAYPGRAGDQGMRKAFKQWNARIKEGYAPPQMVDGAKRYAEYIRSTGSEGTQYVKQAGAFLGHELHFLEPWTLPLTKAGVRLNSNISAAEEFLRRTEPTDETV